MIFEHQVNNIRKLMAFWNLSISDLAEKTGLTVNGIKHMFENASFKLDNLYKIADVLGVPIFVIFAKEIEIETVFEDGKEIVKIKWTPFGDPLQLTTKEGKLINPFYSGNQDLIEEQNKEIYILSDKLKEVETELSLKNENIAFLKEQLEFYKHQSEALKFLNEQLIKSGKEGTPPTDPPG